MNSQKESDFLSTYQKIHFQNNSNDIFKTADTKRKCLAQTFKTSHNLLNNPASCDVLSDTLTEYSDLVNDLKGINNYADNLKVLTSQLAKKDYTQWKSGLDCYDVSELLEPLACGKDCSNASDMKEQLDMLFQNKDDNLQNNLNPLFLSTDEKTKHEEKENLFGKQFQQQPTNSFPRNKQNQLGPSKTFNNYTNKPNFENTNRNCYVRESKSENSSQEDEKPNKFGMFKTAKDEFHEQNVRKYGKAGANGQQSLNYGAQKRSLGTRRGVQSKFVPPVKIDSEGGSATLSRHNSNNNEQTEEQTDERLKNIDPKMVELIRSEIMENGAVVGWGDIAGLQFAKTAIQEAVVWPLLRPDIFTGLRRPPKGILLFGPPGTGKTLIGKCIASQSQSTFFSISASSLTSKWIGDGEKMVRAMFAVARVHQPAVIFIDEIDSLLSQRSDTEHESSRRIKTEFLVQLDGAGTAEEERLLLVGATNRPQELDEAARRRFVKRLYIPLPDTSARLEIVRRLMSSERNSLTESDMGEIADLSAGFSGADMKNLCSEASLGPIRSIDFTMIQNIQAEEVRPVSMGDFKSALNRVRASVSSADLDQYITWDKTYGSGGW